MKKRNIILILLTLSGIVTALTFVISNTITSRNLRELAISSSNVMPPVEMKPEKTASPTDSSSPTSKQTHSVAEPASVPVSAPAPEIEEEPLLTFAFPINGEIITTFSSDVLVFSETYNDYRTHMGIDILGDKNAPVLAIADGIVSQNYFDYEEGITVEIEHKDGYSSLYKNLGNSKMAPVGKIVKQGEAISSIGDTGIFENNMPYHLHLELKKDNEYIDPLTVIAD